jgi:hypothetical protein
MLDRVRERACRSNVPSCHPYWPKCLEGGEGVSGQEPDYEQDPGTSSGRESQSSAPYLHM